MLSVEKVGRVRRVQRHGLESFVLKQRRTGPFPRSAEVALAREAAATSRHWLRHPVAETDIGTAEIDKETIFIDLGRGRQWWCLFHAVIDQVSVVVSVSLHNSR